MTLNLWGYFHLSCLNRPSGERETASYQHRAAPGAAMTSTKSKLPTHYEIGTDAGLEAPSIILAEQLRTID